LRWKKESLGGKRKGKERKRVCNRCDVMVREEEKGYDM